MELNPEPLLLNNLMNELKIYTNEHLRAAGKEHIEFILDDSNFIASCVINIDAKRLHQALTVLLENAVKFTNNGSIRFGYRQSSPADMLEFFVEDTGIGINQDKQMVIFDSFRQIEFDSARNYEGMGLGLTLCRGLIELMDGKIWVKSKEGSGTTVYISVPYLR